MVNISLADAKAQLSALVERVVRGEAVRITRRGKPVVQLTRLDAPRRKIDVAALRAATDAMTEGADVDWVRALRDEARY